MKTKKPSDELSKLLGTGDREAQVTQVKRLLGAPVIDIVIRVDARVDQVTGLSVIGGTLTPDMFYKVLDQVRNQVHQAELQQVAATKNNGAQEPAPEPTA